jgi:hypothetical protein
MDIDSGPRANQTHPYGPEEHPRACSQPTETTQSPPASVTQEVFHQQLGQRGIDQQARGDGVHDTDQQKSSLGVWTVRRM